VEVGVGVGVEVEVEVGVDARGGVVRGPVRGPVRGVRVRGLRAETGTRAPTPVVVASISATSWLSQLMSKSKPIAVGPRSYARAARSCGGVPA
jgi:hypothetical protein